MPSHEMDRCQGAIQASGLDLAKECRAIGEGQAAHNAVAYGYSQDGWRVEGGWMGDSVGPQGDLGVLEVWLEGGCSAGRVGKLAKVGGEHQHEHAHRG